MGLGKETSATDDFPDKEGVDRRGVLRKNAAIRAAF
jgi:hypothetical protein